MPGLLGLPLLGGRRGTGLAWQAKQRPAKTPRLLRHLPDRRFFLGCDAARAEPGQPVEPRFGVEFESSLVGDAGQEDLESPRPRLVLDGDVLCQLVGHDS